MSVSDDSDRGEGEWSAEFYELSDKRRLALRMGGERNVRRQHEYGKSTARERIELLVDDGSFREFGILAGAAKYGEDGKWAEFTPANAIIGTGKIGGRKLSVSADDFTIRGGSSESTVSEKWIYAERYAFEMRMPLVRLVDTAGGSVKLLEKQQGTKIPGYPTWPVVPLLETVPVVGLAMGACAGLGAIKVMASHFSVMVRETSQVFAGGPPVVKQALGIDIDKNELGGYRVHSRETGAVDNEAANEGEAIEQARRFLSYLPPNIWSLPPRSDCEDSVERQDRWLDSAVPKDARKPYDMRKVLATIFDRGTIFEIGRYHGRSTVTCLARLGGVPVGVMANDPRVLGGAMTSSASNKIERFVEMCDTFHLPVVNFVDQPGNMVGPDAERDGTLIGAIRVLKAIERTDTPWISIMVRRAFGLAAGLHGRKHGKDGRSINHRFAWPSAKWGSIPIEGGVQAAYSREINAADDPARRRQELEDYYGRLASPFRTAARFGIVDIIYPSETRRLLCDWVEDAWNVLETRLPSETARR